MALGSSTVLATALTACGLFGAGGFYSSSVLNAPVDPDSARYVKSIVEAGDRGGFWMAADPAERVNLADDATPAYPVRQKVPYHQFPVPYPWRPDFYVEPLSDAHAMVVQTQACEIVRDLPDDVFRRRPLGVQRSALEFAASLRSSGAGHTLGNGIRAFAVCGHRSLGRSRTRLDRSCAKLGRSGGHRRPMEFRSTGQRYRRFTVQGKRPVSTALRRSSQAAAVVRYITFWPAKCGHRSSHEDLRCLLGGYCTDERVVRRTGV